LSTTLDRSRPPEAAAIRPHRFPTVERRRLENGLTFLHARHGNLPLVTVQAVLDAGGAAERSGEEGLGRLTAEALEGGTRLRSGDELAWALEQLGGQLATHTTWDGVYLSLTTHSARLGEALALLAEIVREPAFAEREVERLQGEQLAAMMSRRSDPRALADDSAVAFIYGDGTTYGRSLLGTEASVAGFTAQHVREYHRIRYVPGRAAVVVAGDVSAQDAAAAVTNAFGDWQGTVTPALPVVATPRHQRTAVHVVDRPGAVQSELRIGHVGVPRDTADYYPLVVMTTLLGGAFTSRLNVNLRERHGFTYGVRSAFAFRRAAGPFIVQTAVASDVTARAVEETLKELRTLVDDGVTPGEVASARDFIAGTMPLQMQTSDQLAARLAELHTFDLPVDHFETAREQVRAVTPEEVHRVARLRLQLDRLVVTVVGNAEAVVPDLSALQLADVQVTAAPEGPRGGGEQ
jgi:zinc protease